MLPRRPRLVRIARRPAGACVLSPVPRVAALPQGGLGGHVVGHGDCSRARRFRCHVHRLFKAQVFNVAEASWLKALLSSYCELKECASP
jgi:hypothetical protein